MGYSLKAIIRKDKINQNGECPIVIRITIGSQYYRHPIGENIRPQDWNSEDDIPKKSSKNRDIIRSKIEKEKSKITDLVSHFYYTHNNSYPSLYQLKRILKGSQGLDGSMKNKSIIDFYKEFVDDYSLKKRLSELTIKAYNSTGERLKEYFKKNEIIPSWDIFNDVFYEEFVSYYVGKGYKESSIGKSIKNIKTFLYYIYLNYKFISPDIFKNYKVLRESPDFPILNNEDLLLMKFHIGLISLSKKNKELFNNSLKLNDKEKRLLRMMLFICFTGLSYVDFQKITILDIDKVGDLKEGTTLGFVYVRQKTNITNRVYVTLTEDLIEIILSEIFNDTRLYPDRINPGFKIIDSPLPQKIKSLWRELDLIKKGNGEIKKRDIHHKRPAIFRSYPSLFPKMSNQVFNREIKLVCEKIGIDQNYKLLEKRYGKVQEKNIPKHKLISSVTGRRTFISGSLKDGIPYEVLMKSTGHRDIKTLMRYSKVNQDLVNSEFLSKRKKIVPTEEWERKQKLLKYAKELGIDPTQMPGTGISIL